MLKKVLCFLIAGQIVSAADLKLDGLFADHMVMQCEKPLPVRGWAAPGAAVTVEFAGQKKNTAADADGQWQITLDPLEVSSVPRDLNVSSTLESGISNRKLTDVLVGEVWVCSGQSNMEVAMPACSNAAQEIAAADYPEIRLMSIPKRVDIHLRGNPPEGILWKRCSPQSVAEFSAAGYFFGRHIHRELKVPVGLVAAAWGGTKIQAWTPLAVQEEQPWSGPLLAPWQQLEQAHPDLRENFDAYGRTYVRDFLLEQKDSWQWKLRREAALKAGKEFSEPAPKAISAPYPGHRDTPGGLYGGMIHALTRMPVRGVIWYQGESDAGAPGLYERQFSLLIQEWRKAWNNSELPFYFVQLASWKPLQRVPVEENGWSDIREAQRLVSERIHHTGMAVAIDIGDANTVHPLNKQDVGKRLALLALNRTYGHSCIDSGPAYAGMEKDGGKLRLNFRSADGLMSDKPQIEGFAVRGEKTAWQWAQARIEGASVVVWNDQVPKPVAVRYAWASNPKGSLRNSAALPAAPFQDTLEGDVSGTGTVLH